MKYILCSIYFLFSLKSFASVSSGDIIKASDINRIQDYSSSEVVTGGVFFGKPVYRKCVTGQNMNTSATVITGINADILVKSYGSYIFNSTRRISFPYTGTSFMYSEIRNNEIYVNAHSNYNGDGIPNLLDACFEYTKTTD